MKAPRLRRLVRFLLVDQVKEVGGILLGKKGQGTLRAHMVWGTVGTFSLKILNTALAFGTSVLLARLLGAKEYGVYAYAISWASLLSVPAVMGLNTLLVREVARYKTLEDWGSLRGILRWSDRVVLVTSTGLAALFALIVWALRGRFDPEVRMALWIVMALVPLLSFLLLRQGGLQGLGYVVEAQVPQFLILPGVFLILVCAVYFPIGVDGTSAVGLRVVSGLIAALTALFFLRRHLPEPVTDVSPLYHQREWLKSVLPLLFVGAAGIINQRISIVMVGSMLGSEAAGIFDIAMKGAALVSFVLMAVNMPLAPAVAELYARGEKERLQCLITKSARVALLGSLPIALVMMLAGSWVLSIFGKGFTSGAMVLAILSAGQLVNVGSGPVGILLNMTGHERDTVKGVGVAALINVILNSIFVPIWGLKGAAIANAVSVTCWYALLIAWAYKRLGLCPTALGTMRKVSWGIK